MRLTGTTMVEVPYRTTQGAYPDMLAGRVDLLFDSAAAALPYITAKKVRGVALLAPERYRTVPDLPTITEAGLQRARHRILDRPVRAGRHAARGARQAAPRHADRRRRAQGEFETSGGGLMQMPVAETDKFIKSEFDLWTRVIRGAGIQLD